MNNFIEKIYNDLVTKTANTEPTSKDYKISCEKLQNLLYRFEAEILADPAINSRKDYYDLAAEISSHINKLHTILHIEGILKEVD